MLRFSHRPNQIVGTDGGWLVASSLAPPFVPALAGILGSWLPAPVSSELLGVTGPETSMHLAWSAVTGLGVGLIVRGRVARFDDQSRALTEPDERGLVRRFAADDAGADWWGRIPVSGPIRDDLDAFAARL